LAIDDFCKEHRCHKKAGEEKGTAHLLYEKSHANGHLTGPFFLDKHSYFFFQGSKVFFTSVEAALWPWATAMRRRVVDEVRGACFAKGPIPI
jgi:hypothetical protein